MEVPARQRAEQKVRQKAPVRSGAAVRERSRAQARETRVRLRSRRCKARPQLQRSCASCLPFLESVSALAARLRLGPPPHGDAGVEVLAGALELHSGGL